MLKRSAHVCLLDPVTSLPVVFGDSPAQHMAAVRPAPTRGQAVSRFAAAPRNAERRPPPACWQPAQTCLSRR